MPSVRVTLISNAQQNVRCAAVLSLTSETARTAILDYGKRKLRLKKPSRIFLPGGQELDPSSPWLSIVQNDSVLLVSCGEEYVGVRSDAASASSPHGLVHIVARTTYVDPDAVKQLNTTAQLPGIIYAAGMPDLHPGNRFPIGASFLSRGVVYPPLIGGDIGCGMALFATPLSAHSEPRKLADKMRGLEGGWPAEEGDTRVFLETRGVKPTTFDKTTLGTVGGGNHFAELQALETIHDADACAAVGLSQDRLHLLVHTGSRGLGQAVLHQQPPSLQVGTAECDTYMHDHDHACAWASANRALVARRVFSRLCPSADLDALAPLFEITHNNVVPHALTAEDTTLAGITQDSAGNVLIHRKGAAPSLGGNEPLIIPGSRGARTYVLLSTGPQARNAFSVAHGAGRSIARSQATARRPTEASRLARAMKEAEDNGLGHGGRVVCEDSELIFEEAPDCYKDVDDVVEDLVQAGVVRVIGVMRPVVTYKMRKE
jgi:release factor H-coupled RctB family protein